MRKRIAMLLNGPINNDYRVIKIIQTLSEKHEIYLFYINGISGKDELLFNSNVRLKWTEHNESKRLKILRHSFFCYEFNYMKKLVLSSGCTFDCIWANDLPTLYPAFSISKVMKCKLVYDSHEIYTETINQFFPRNASGIKGHLFRFLIFFMRKHGNRIEKKIIPFVDLFITVNTSLLEYFHQSSRIKKGLVVMNVPHFSSDTDGIAIDYRNMYSWRSDDRILLYQGQLNEGRGLRILIEAMKLLPQSYKLVLLGNGALKSDLIKLTDNWRLTERIIFIDAVNLKDLPKYTRGADVGLNLLESFNLSKKLASPNKLFEYIHSDIPIVASNSPENVKVFDLFKIGVLTEMSAEDIKNAIQEMENLETKALKQNLNDAKVFYNWEKQEELLHSTLNSIFI